MVTPIFGFIKIIISKVGGLDSGHPLLIGLIIGQQTKLTPNNQNNNNHLVNI